MISKKIQNSILYGNALQEFDELLEGVICVKQQTFYVHFKNNHLE